MKEIGLYSPCLLDLKAIKPILGLDPLPPQNPLIGERSLIERALNH